eukprot:g4021.t1
MSAFRCLWAFVTEFSKLKSIRKPPENSTPSPTTDPRRSRSEGSLKQRQTERITAEEVAKHNSRDDCWIIIKDKVYDVTDFSHVHPGGSIILTQGGRNATDVFTSFHAASSWSLLNKYYIGDLVTEKKQSPELIEDFRRLRIELRKKGLFKANRMFYIKTLLLNLSILLTAIAILTGGGESDISMSQLMISAFLLALFFQQSGWLAHDFLHHQVFFNRKWNTVCGLIIGNFFQGFSVDWWKNKHNTHHAVTNEIDGSHSAVDPDIDTLPLIAWSLDMLKTVKNPSERLLIKYQQYLFFPVLLFARFSWAQQSFTHALSNFLTNKDHCEFGLLLMHYLWHFGIAFFTLSFTKAVLFLLICQAISGFLLGFAFVQSHNGMEVHGQNMDFVTSQVISTRNITYSPFVNFFMGGLNFQIEHHLFPTMPRHNLKEAQIGVRKLCEKHDLPYEECSMALGTKRVIQRLVEIARHA